MLPTGNKRKGCRGTVPGILSFVSIIPVALSGAVLALNAGDHGRAAAHDDAAVGGTRTWLMSLGLLASAPAVRSMGLSVLPSGLTLGGFVAYRVREGMEGAR